MQRPIRCLNVTRALCFFVVLLPLTLPLSLQADTLADIYELALENDAELKAAEATYKAGRESKNQGRAALLPQVIASGNYTETDADAEQSQFNPQTLGSVDITGTTNTDSKLYSISLQQALFDMPAWFNFKQTKQLSKQAKAQFSADQQAMIIRVAEAYFNVLRAADNLQTSNAEVAALQRQLEQTQQRFEVGLIAITEVYEARAVHDTAVVTKLEAKGELAISYEALTVLTGQPHSNLWQLDEEFPITKPTPIKRAEWVDFALQNNFALQAAGYAAEASRQNAKAKKSEHLPKLSGSYAYNDSTNSGDFDIDNGPKFPQDSQSEGSTVSLNLELPLFTGGFTSSARRQAYQEYIQSRETFINTQRNTIQAARSLHLTVVTDVGKVKARDLAITSAQSALDATQAGYEVGTRNIVDVLESQRFLFRALFDFSNAKYDYVINMLRLKEQSGILSPEDVYALNKWLEKPKPPSAKKQSSNN